MTFVCKIHIKQRSKMSLYQLFIILWGSLSKRTPKERKKMQVYFKPYISEICIVICTVLMETNRKVELESQVLPLNNQNITSEAPKLLPCSSIVSVSDLGSNQGTTFTTGIGKERSDDKWHYLFLHNKELKRYIEIFTGKKSVMIKTSSGSKEERHFCFKVFSYTTADHKRRFEHCHF